MGICDLTQAELASAYGKRRFTLTISLDMFLEETEARFTIIPITARTCARIVSLSSEQPPWRRAFPRSPRTV